MDLFCSAIIPTIGRPVLSRAVCSVLDQSSAASGLEVIVVNDSAQPLPPADWQQDARVRVITTNRRERCVARNTGAALAGGRYLLFLDDDDRLLPGALTAFRTLAQNTDAAWLYGSYQTVDNQGCIVEEIRPGITGNIFALLVAGEGIPLQASLLLADHFHAVGAFDPRPDIIGVEDRDLGRRMALTGDIAYTPLPVAEIRIGQENSSTDWSRIAERDRWGREKALLAPNAVARLRQSATTSYLRGRVSRAQFASTAWNLQRRNLFMALSRMVAGIALAGPHLLTPTFWQGMRTKIA